MEMKWKLERAHTPTITRYRMTAGVCAGGVDSGILAVDCWWYDLDNAQGLRNVTWAARAWQSTNQATNQAACDMQLERVRDPGENPSPKPSHSGLVVAFYSNVFQWDFSKFI